MEALNSMAHTAAKVVWGDGTNQTEPASGVHGDVAKGEPFDGGNLASEAYNKEESTTVAETSGNNKDSAAFKPDTAQTPKDSNNKLEKPDLDKPTVPSDKEAVTDTAKTDTTSKDPTDEPEAAAEKQESVMGDGPKPLATIAKENGGDAGNLRPDGEASASDKTDDPVNDEERAKEQKSKGTGEEYVKTSGLAADGGDFDATLPGAGREADRLMEEKGMHREGQDDGKKEHKTSGNDVQDDKQKPSLKERVKDKLHLH